MTHTDSPRRAVLNLRDERPAWALPAATAAALAGAFPADWEVIDVQAPVSGRGDGGGLSAEALAAVRSAEVWIGYGFPRELLAAHMAHGPITLRWIHTAAAGVRSMMHAPLLDAGVRITNAAGVHAEPIADTVLAGMLHFARGVDFAVRSQQQHRWEKEPFEEARGDIRELAGAQVGIVGYGGIGRAVARRSAALGMRVQALRRSSAADAPGVRMVHGADGLDTLVSTSDYLVVALPSTTVTERLLDAARLARMPAHAVLINVGRGDVIDEAALVDVLAGRRIRGAVLDVFETEPLAPDSPLWSLENVLVLPHVSATTPRFWERQTDLILDNVRRYLSGDPLRNLVDASRGY